MLISMLVYKFSLASEKIGRICTNKPIIMMMVSCCHASHSKQHDFVIPKQLVLAISKHVPPMAASAILKTLNIFLC